MTNPNIQFRCPEDLFAELDSRVGVPGGVARRDLARYYALLAYALRGFCFVVGKLSRKVLADAVEYYGTLEGKPSPIEARGYLLVAFDEYSNRHRFDGVDVDKLRTTLAGLTHIVAVAVLDAAERGALR